MNPFTVSLKSLKSNDNDYPTEWYVILEFAHADGQKQTVPITVFRFELGNTDKKTAIINHALRQAIPGQVVLACGHTVLSDWLDNLDSSSDS